MKIVLISTYELGRQPFGLASPAAWLRACGHAVTALDLSRQELDERAVREARLIAFFLPMHTAARLTLPLVPLLRAINPVAEFCVYGLYASLAEDSFRQVGVQHFFSGEFEQGVCDFADALGHALAANANNISAQAGAQGIQKRSFASRTRLRMTSSSDTGSPGSVGGSVLRQQFLVPDRSGLPELHEYAHVILPEGGHQVSGYTEASRGCKHVCRHCPVVPVYNGIFRIVDREVVLADIRQQVAAGAQHITFGDPDFFNGIGHALAIVRELHREFPAVTYDATIKIEHLRKRERELAVLRETNCLFVTSAVESLDDDVLRKLEKGHTRADFVHVVGVFREIGLTLQPTFVPFTPWTTLAKYGDLLETLRDLDLVENVAPIQLAIRLLIPAKSRLLELPDIARMVDRFDENLLVYPWKHADPRVDELAAEVESIAAQAEKQKWSRAQAFEQICEIAGTATGAPEHLRAAKALATTAPKAAQNAPFARTSVPYLNEPWYC